MQLVLYTNGSQECERAETYLDSQDGSLHVYRLDEDFTISQFQAEFGFEAEFPQISVGYRHIGGLKETLNFFEYDRIN